MAQKSIFLTRWIPEAGLELLREKTNLHLYSSNKEKIPAKNDTVEGVKNAYVLISLVTEKIDRDIMEANPNLLGISNYAVGYDNIDIHSATQLGIPVTNTPGVLTDTTADIAWALIMAVSRRIVEADKFLRNKKFKTWVPDLMLGADISKGGSKKQKTLGIIGYGKIGKAVRKRAAGFDMKVIVYSPNEAEHIKKTDVFEYCELDELLKESDFITLHTPLNETTKHLIGERELSLMKETAYLINTSRGPVVDEQALIKALKEKKIAGAGLDVFEREPHVPDELIELDNVVLLPHIGSASTDTRNEMARMTANNALSLLNGEKSGFTVNPDVYNSEEYKKKGNILS